MNILYLLLIVFIVITVLFTIIIAYEENGIMLWEVIVSSIIGAILSLIIVGITTKIIRDNASTHLELSEVRYLKAFADNTNGNINGNFFLGSGSINSSPEYYYYYFVDSAKTTVKMDEMSATSNEQPVYIIESDSTTPRVEIYRNVFNSNTNFFLKNSRHYREIGKYIIYVPKNSILTNFNLDLK